MTHSKKSALIITICYSNIMSLSRAWIKLSLFVVSYFPLILLTGILHYDDNRILTGLVVFTIFGMVGLFSIIYYCKTIVGTPIKGTEIKSGGSINFQYFLAYVIPFIAIDIDSNRQLLAYAVLFIFTGMIYIKSNLIYINPTLTILGFHLFEFKTKKGICMLITKKNKVNALSKLLVRIDEDLYYE